MVYVVKRGGYHRCSALENGRHITSGQVRMGRDVAGPLIHAFNKPIAFGLTSHSPRPLLSQAMRTLNVLAARLT